MKLISLNTWGGKLYGKLMDFIKQNSKDTDIYCFQEIYTSSTVKQYKDLLRANLLEELKKILPDFQVFYFPTLEGYDTKANPVGFDLVYGSAIFVKNSISVISHEDYFIHKDENFKSLNKDFSNLTTPLQYISFYLNNKKFSIFNFHGLPFPSNKLDSPIRIIEAEKVKSIVGSKDGAKILVGDFNLLPQTKCIKIFEKDMRNLIKEFNIKKTRSNLSSFSKNPDFQKFADYTFVSGDIEVLDFQVPDIGISDHLPLIIEFS